MEVTKTRKRISHKRYLLGLVSLLLVLVSLCIGQNPCQNITCGRVCRGEDLWEQRCIGGECVDSRIVEDCSKECGCDPCKNIVCVDGCYGPDLWRMKCLEGECVPDYIIERDSEQCAPEQEADHDQDGIPDNSDSCYNPGCTIVDEHGCPRNTDGDGLPDCYDDCPAEAGEKANNGCPVEEAVELEGTLWKLDSYVNNVGNLVSVLPNTEITAQFQNGKVGGSGGCNNYFGDYNISGNAITIGALSSTLMLCTMPDGIMAQEGNYLAALQSAASYEIKGNRLVITNAVGDVILVFTAA